MRGCARAVLLGTACLVRRPGLPGAQVVVDQLVLAARHRLQRAPLRAAPCHNERAPSALVPFPHLAPPWRDAPERAEGDAVAGAVDGEQALRRKRRQLRRRHASCAGMHHGMSAWNERQTRRDAARFRRRCANARRGAHRRSARRSGPHMGAAPSAAPLRCRRRARWPAGRWRRRSRPQCRTAAPSAPSRPPSSPPPRRRAAARRRRRLPCYHSGTAGRAREAGSVQRRRAGARGRRDAAGRRAQAANGAGSATQAGRQPKRLSDALSADVRHGC